MTTGSGITMLGWTTNEEEREKARKKLPKTSASVTDGQPFIILET